MRRKDNKNKKEHNGGNLSEVTEVPRIITPGGPTADLGLCKENLSEVEQQQHTTIQPTHTSHPHAQPQLGCDVSRVTIAPKGDSVAINNNNQFVQP